MVNASKDYVRDFYWFRLHFGFSGGPSGHNFWEKISFSSNPIFVAILDEFCTGAGSTGRPPLSLELELRRENGKQPRITPCPPSRGVAKLRFCDPFRRLLVNRNLVACRSCIEKMWKRKWFRLGLLFWHLWVAVGYRGASILTSSGWGPLGRNGYPTGHVWGQALILPDLRLIGGPPRDQFWS